MLSTLVDFTAGYSPVESFLFDRLCDKATAPLHAYALAGIAPAIQPNMRVLDVGCGGGRFAIRLAERYPDITVVGLDLSPEQIARARRRGADLAERVSFVEGSATDMPFEVGEFDLVYSLGSLKHWPDHAQGLRECVRVLNPGGRLWLTEGDRGCRHEDVHAFISTWNIPARARPLAATFYRVVVVGQSLDLDDARSLLEQVPELEGAVERGAGLPIWVLEGTKQGFGARP
ncbi:MAG TPA: class I SAM-dependent methyltransferase [Enhygromyxa sp.]|nr:class I SAM-dependent methyltransferase [Enhygromyxa sp.]